MSPFTNITWCDWCVADSGRTHATRPCCIVRRIAKMMPASRMRALADDGSVELRYAVLGWIATRLGKMNKDDRQAAYRRVQRDGWSTGDLETLKRLAREEFDKGQADGS